MDVKPLFSFGIVADIQYADKDEGFQEKRNQRYTEALEKLQVAVNSWMQRKEELSFILTLGDIVDGRPTQEQTIEDLDKVLDILKPMEERIQIHHVLGNHCVKLPRDYIQERLHVRNGYYVLDIFPQWKLVVLDSTDMSVLNGNVGSIGYQEADQYLQQHPQNQYPNALRWNGGLSQVQFNWFQEVLKEASEQNINLLVALHHPIVGAPERYLVWNTQELLKVFGEHPNVRCVFSGHYHPGAYGQHEGQHFVTPAAIVECPKDEVAYGVVHVFEDHLTIEGSGIVTSQDLSFKQF